MVLCCNFQDLLLTWIQTNGEIYKNSEDFQDGPWVKLTKMT